MKITKRLEFDYGHRVPSHKSKCRSPHGHRGALEVTLEGSIQSVRGESDDGMVLDFSDIKLIAKQEVGDKWDHAFLVYKGDEVMRACLEAGECLGWRIVVLSCIPTAENLANVAFETLYNAYKSKYGDRLELKKVRFYETPNSWAEVTCLVKVS